MASDDLFAKDADSLMNQMTRLSLHPKLSAYPSKEDDAAMRALIHALETAQAERIRQVAGAINTQQRLEARKEQWRQSQRLGDNLKEGGLRDVWRGWMELLKWEMLVSEVEDRLGLVAF